MVQNGWVAWRVHEYTKEIEHLSGSCFFVVLWLLHHYDHGQLNAICNISYLGSHC